MASRHAPYARFRHLPFFYGWVIVGIGFVTMAISVTARTSYSLLLPPLLDEFGWDRGLVAGAFSFGFLVSAVLGPLIGRLMDRRGPRVVIEMGVMMMSCGLVLAVFIREPWQLYLTLGVLAGAGANCMSYTVQSSFLPNWFVRRRGLALSITFSGVGVGAIVLLPLLQSIIQEDGWRTACFTIGIVALVVLGPINLFIWHRPEDVGQRPDGASEAAAAATKARASSIVDPAWASTDWTLHRALRTARFWWIALGYASAMFAWYAVQVHQTKYLIEIGIAPLEAALALGLVSIVAIPGQIALGALSDRIGREWVWSVGCIGFAICYIALIGLEHHPTRILLYVMVIAQGLLGYALPSVMGPIAVEIFEGPQYGRIFGTLSIALVVGGAIGPWAAGVIYDRTGSYNLGFIIAIACCVVSSLAIWLAAPRTVRRVAGRR